MTKIYTIGTVDYTEGELAQAKQMAESFYKSLDLIIAPHVLLLVAVSLVRYLEAVSERSYKLEYESIYEACQVQKREMN